MTSPQTTYSAQIADFAANLAFDDVPGDVRSVLPIFLLDAFSSVLAGVIQPVFVSAAKAVLQTHSAGDLPAINSIKTSLSGAMLLNGIACGDFELEHVIANAHPASAVLPALLTVAAQAHSSGPEFLTAMALGYEVATRIGAASGHEVEALRGFHNPGLNGTIAAATAVGRLLNLDARKMANAMGIAASSSAGLMSFVTTGSMTKRLHPARASQLGAEAAFMAQEGIEGPTDVLDNALGFFHAFSPHPLQRRLIEGLGRTWMGSRMRLKLSPVHAYAQFPVYAINQARSENATGLPKPEEIDSIIVECGPSTAKPSHQIPSPNTLVSAQYSVRFAVAAALTIDLRNPLNMNDKLLSHPIVHRLAEKTTVKQVTDDRHDLTAKIIISLASGQTWHLHASHYPGLPGSAGYAEAAEDKFQRVTSALRIDSKCGELGRHVRNVSLMGDVSEIYFELVEMADLAVAQIDRP